ncbi:MAG: alpha/beta hydrolase [Natronospirillum sp.]|uniref:alpha/beta fold hydrolase n=1 Tax=Natronospirillum sp. TaxID=2812955 RepID=UPI0025F93A52|nr:alpha/beta hydrolase [Natronospirillum sp.]MCH8551307.1 alpha/beta hydrolase [Natronospirillum sp.]
MVEWTHRVLGVTLAGCQWGDPAAPGERTLICAHGWQDNAASFQALGAALEQMGPAGWQLIAVDLPGHGLSDHLPPSQFYNLWDFIPLLAGWLESRPGPNWLCGHSMGAMVMTQLAVARPDLTCGLLTLDMLGQSFDVDAEAQVSRLAKVLGEQSRGLPGSQPSPDLAHATRRRMRFGSPATAQANEALVRRGAKQTTEGWCFRLDPRVRHGSVMRPTTDQVIALGHMIDCPWHVILGEQGLFDPQRVREWQPNWPAVRIQWWPGGHHFHMESQTPALWQTIRQLMDSE